MTKKSFKIRSNLAEALGDTVTSAKNNAGELHIEIIPLRKISLDPDNPRDLALTFPDLYDGISDEDANFNRKESEKNSLKSLVKSIEEQGVINPIVVYKFNEQYRLIAGERRTLGSIIAGKNDIPAKVLTSKPDQLKLSLLQWIENIEREDLSLWERIRNLDKILNAYARKEEKDSPVVTPTELSQLVGCSLQQGVNYRHVLNASETLRKHIQLNDIKNIEKAAVIAKSSLKIQPLLIEACLNGATLSHLKKMAKDNALVSLKSKKGRPISKINFGTTSNSNVAKTLMDCVFKNEKFQHFQTEIGPVKWDDSKSIAVSFRKLVKLLEQG